MLLRRKLTTALTMMTLIALSASAMAAPRPRVGLDSATVTINGRAAIRFQASNGSLTPAQRAEITAQRLMQLVATGVDANTIYAKGDANQGRVYAGETMICIATAADAKVNRTTPLALATSWASNIRSLLLMPPVVLSAKDLLVPLGENRRVEVGGAATGAIYARSENTEVATVSVGTDGRYVQVLGQQVGSTMVEVSVEGERVYLPVMVKKYAGMVPSGLSAEVTGNPCPASFVSYAAKQAVMHSAVIEPGAKLEISSVDGAQPSVPGQSRSVKVTLKIDGADYIPNAGQVTVSVHNTQMPRESLEQLFYSNNPERLLKYQTLFAGKLDINQSTRVLYHHQNMIGKKVHLIVEIINPAEVSASFRVLKGVSSPNIDTVMVGHVAGNNFLRDFYNNVSIIEKIPAKSRLVLVSDMLEHQQTASGILQIRQMDGSPAFVRITAAQPYVDNVSVGTIAAAPNPLMLEMSDHVYPSPAKTLEADYTVGGRWAFISIGKHAVTDSAAQKKLYGNYGVTYDINLKVQNPTGEKKKVSVLFEPSAGLASGVFIVDGKFVLAKYAQPPSEVPIASYDLQPGETRTVKITTVPLAGSNYPATLVVRS